MGGKVLVVDDSITILELVTATLEPEGFQTIEASDGEDALAKLETATGVVLVICDVSMPLMNGLDFVENARKRGHTMPVVMLTTGAQPELMDRARRLGVKGWMLKPVRQHHLVAAVRAVISAGPMALGRGE